MSDPVPQSYPNHRRFDPLYHFFAAPVLFVLLPLYAIVHLVRHFDLHSGFLLLVSVALAALTYRVRSFPLVVQDRVIELEERLRLERLLPPNQREMARRLRQGQLIGLRFASDEELPDLAMAAIAENLTRNQIKKRVKNWRPDTRRA
jgi:hypothetical protein